ncbi:Protein CBG27599 [Caenorhabditis briggsae]|uniref:Protein CBG27599 n=1 Tax=Caenorhabditis briggsae TaxID=6238 RepID=B6IKG9_CAEBR|nr:Protein CBG27599 [Caenorhabditis briggsae]CAS00399.1 Protein CBG27599 [Caenorhabditis briggsae]
MGKLASGIKIVFESLITLLSTLEDTHLILLKLKNLPDDNTVHLYAMQAYVSEGFSKIGEKKHGYAEISSKGLAIGTRAYYGFRKLEHHFYYVRCGDPWCSAQRTTLLPAGSSPTGVPIFF